MNEGEVKNEPTPKGHSRGGEEGRERWCRGVINAFYSKDKISLYRRVNEQAKSLFSKTPKEG